MKGSSLKQLKGQLSPIIRTATKLLIKIAINHSVHSPVVSELLFCDEFDWLGSGNSLKDIISQTD